MPAKKDKTKTNIQYSFTPEYVAVIDHRNHNFNIYHKQRCRLVYNAFRNVHNRCKNVLENENCSYVKAVQAKIQKKLIGSCEFWKRTKQIMNRSNAAVPTIINGTGVISSSTDKSKLSTSIFASNSTLNDKGHTLSIFLRLTKQTLRNIFI